MVLNAITWNIDPAIFSLGSHEIRWYGLLFGVGLVIFGPMIMEKMWKHEKLESEWLYPNLFWYVIIGTVVGARLGHCFFYESEYFLAHPIEILKPWKGGLASHGGSIGVILACWLYSRRVTHKSILWILDRLAVPVGLVAGMIRLGNLMNSEIFGHATNLPWAFRFPRSKEYWQAVPDGLSGCHPTQIYEALCYFAVFGICMWLYWRRDAAKRYSGLIVGFFLIGIFLSRFIIEQVKIVQEDWEINMISSIGMNMGQLLSIPFVLIGIWLVVRALMIHRRETTLSANKS